MKRTDDFAGDPTKWSREGDASMNTANKIRFTVQLKLRAGINVEDAAYRQNIIEQIKDRLSRKPSITDVEDVNVDFEFAEGPVEMEEGKPIHQSLNPYPPTLFPYPTPFPTTSGPGAPLIGKPATFPDTEDGSGSASGSGSGSGSASPSS